MKLEVEEVFERLVSIIKTDMQCEVTEKISPSTNLYEDLAFDSLQIMGLLAKIEDTFAITIRLDQIDIGDLSTIDGLMQIIFEAYQGRS